MADKLNRNGNFQLITGIITIILHDLHLICSFILSYPLYFSYAIFFFPYVTKLISFISPLFIVTVFLSLLITTTTTAFCPNLKQLKLGIVKIVVQELKLDLDEVIGDERDCDFEEFEIYKIVFDCDLLIMIGDQSDELGYEKLLERSVYEGRRSDVADSESDMKKLGIEKRQESSVHDGWKRDVASSSSSDVDKLCPAQNRRKNDVATSDSDVKKLRVEKFLETSVYDCRKIDVATSNLDVKELGSFHGGRKTDLASCVLDITKSGSVHGGRKNEVGTCNSDVNKLGIEKLIEELDKFEEYTPEIKSGTDFIKAKGELQKVDLSQVKKVGNESKTLSSIDHEELNETFLRSNSSSIVSSYGSMREEKEWRKTLACKLFEERHNSLGGEEGMDSLWDTHENDNSKYQKGITKKKNNISISFATDTDIDTDNDEVVMSNGHLCCLQALKLSTGKMNLGMGKPNIVKISKAFKGFGWLNYVKNKHEETFEVGPFFGLSTSAEETSRSVFIYFEHLKTN